MALPQSPDAAIRQLAAPLAHLGDVGFTVGVVTLVTSWLGLAPGSWSLPALLLVACGFTISTIARSELRGAAVDELVTRLSRSADSELMQFRAELMQPPRSAFARFWSGTGDSAAPRCRWRLAHAACDGYLAAPRREQLCSCNCHRYDAMGLTGRDHASLWLADPERFTRARRRSQRQADVPAGTG